MKPEKFKNLDDVEFAVHTLAAAAYADSESSRLSVAGMLRECKAFGFSSWVRIVCRGVFLRDVLNPVVIASAVSEQYYELLCTLGPSSMCANNSIAAAVYICWYADKLTKALRDLTSSSFHKLLEVKGIEACIATCIEAEEGDPHKLRDLLNFVVEARAELGAKESQL